jgi:hypothetical protein
MDEYELHPSIVYLSGVDGGRLVSSKVVDIIKPWVSFCHVRCTINTRGCFPHLYVSLV